MTDASMSRTADQSRQGVAGAAQAAKDTITGVASDVAESFKESVSESKTSGADAIARIARSTKDAAESMKNDAPQIAGAVRDAAERVERISNDVRDMSFNEMLDSISDFARRKPLLFVGCGLVAGIVASRLLRSHD